MKSPSEYYKEAQSLPDNSEKSVSLFALSQSMRLRGGKGKKSGHYESENSESIKIPKPRKRKTKAKKKTEEELKIEKQKESAKERARKSRDRKKHYTDELEEKVRILEKQVKYLTIELDKYRKYELKNEASLSESDSRTCKEQTILERLLTHLQNSTNLQSFRDTHQAITSKSKMAEGNSLIVLDKALDVVVDFLVPENFMTVFYFLQLKIGTDWYVDEERVKKLRHYSKYQIQEAYDNHEFDDNDLLWHCFEVTDSQIKLFNEFKPKMQH